MHNFGAAQIIEALRSGVSSRALGYTFATARPALLRSIQSSLNSVAEGNTSGGRIIMGKYGEGKTHLLNTVFSMAREQNMVVSYVTLSKETPLSGLHQIYPKLLQKTYLPGNILPGISSLIEVLPASGKHTNTLFEYCLTKLETNKLYYILKSYFGTQDEEEKFQLLADIEGDFISPPTVRKIYRRIFGEPATFDHPFIKAKHTTDYFAMLSKLFVTCGYSGWVLLFDEAELCGRLGKKARQSSYLNIAKFLNSRQFESVYSIFVFNSSFVPDVIESKKEYANISASLSLTASERDTINGVLNSIRSSEQLTPLTREETNGILAKIADYHAEAYGWTPAISTAELLEITEKYGYLLRTRIRAAVELLDQLYQYGTVSSITVKELGQMSFEEDEDSVDIL